MDVGIREFKMLLSQYVDRAAGGEIIRITDRGKPKAILAPLPGRLALDEGIAAGWVKRATSDERPVRVKRQRAARRIDDVLQEDRDE